MAFTNTYKAPSTEVEHNCHLDTKPEDYDFNFMFDVKTLRSDRVELRPFVVSPSPLFGSWRLIGAWMEIPSTRITIVDASDRG